MDEPNLPRDLLERTERRWAAVLQAARRPDRRARGEPSSDNSARQAPESKPAQPKPDQPKVDQPPPQDSPQ